MDLTERWAYIERVAKERLENNITPYHVSRYGPEIEVIGAAGELAARYFLGLDPVLHTEFDGGRDLKWRGKTVDVKATKLTPYLAHRYLQFPKNKKVKSDIILLVAVDVFKKQAAVVGYATKDEMMTSPINFTRHQPCHEISVRKLHPTWELLVPEPV